MKALLWMIILCSQFISIFGDNCTCTCPPPDPKFCEKTNTLSDWLNRFGFAGLAIFITILVACFFTYLSRKSTKFTPQVEVFSHFTFEAVPSNVRNRQLEDITEKTLAVNQARNTYEMAISSSQQADTDWFITHPNQAARVPPPQADQVPDPYPEENGSKLGMFKRATRLALEVETAAEALDAAEKALKEAASKVGVKRIRHRRHLTMLDVMGMRWGYDETCGDNMLFAWFQRRYVNSGQWPCFSKTWSLAVWLGTYLALFYLSIQLFYKLMAAVFPAYFPEWHSNLFT